MNMYDRPMPPDPFRQTDPRLDDDPPEPAGLTWPDAFSVLIKARDTLAWIIARFWSPAAFGALKSIMRSQQRELLTWVRPLELILRRLFLIEAHALAATLSAPAPRATPKAPPAATAQPKEITNDPETWSAPFSTRASVAAPATSHAAAHELVHSWGHVSYRRRHDDDRIPARPLAIRIEALLRAVSDPMRCIRRLAHQIRRQGAPAFASQLAQEACDIPSLRRALALVTETAGPLFSMAPKPPVRTAVRPAPDSS
jgi:hypothetical protein